MDEVFDTPALRVLRRMAREGPINMREFIYTTGHSPRMAKALREKLEADGFVTVAPEESAPNEIVISVTADGRRLAEHSLAQEELAERIKRKHSTDKRG